jgi:hypothetical protein
VCPEKFDGEMAAVKRDKLNKEFALQQRRPDLFAMHTARKGKTNRALYYRRLYSLWTRTNKKTILVSVRDDNGVVHIGDGIFDALQAAWKRMLYVVTEPSQYEERVLEEFVVPFDYSTAIPPTIKSYRVFLGNAADSAPGPDGIPYAAWRAAGISGARTLYYYGHHLANGNEPHADCNMSSMVFPPKGEEPEDDANGVVRHVTAVRPLSLKNSDNKTVAGVYNHCAAPVVARCACLG